METLAKKSNGHNGSPAGSLPPQIDCLDDKNLSQRDGEAIIVLDNVYKGFGYGSRRVQPMNGISLEVHRGESLVVIGPSGTGKSVMLRLMLGLLEPDEGRVLVFGKDIKDMTDDELGSVRTRIAMLFQGGA
ncbi:MAG: ATP-binding cassette domain-containing protein, partial [Planctomycetes bacterium]|nr:ATP-binding cassette domain-containing protein [Planctomycetota bacterium]